MTPAHGKSPTPPRGAATPGPRPPAQGRDPTEIPTRQKEPCMVCAGTPPAPEGAMVEVLVCGQHAVALADAGRPAGEVRRRQRQRRLDWASAHPVGLLTAPGDSPIGRARPDPRYYVTCPVVALMALQRPTAP